jgi:hypothetical protein
MFLYIFPLLGLLSALVQIFFFGKPVIETFLANILFFVVGFGGLFAAMGHIFNADEVAEKIGWSKGNPFQTEVGLANLGYGIAGIISMWYRNEFWFALIICISVFYIGAGIVHITDLKKNKNKAELNIGFPLYYDFILPVILITLLVLYLNIGR